MDSPFSILILPVEQSKTQRGSVVCPRSHSRGERGNLNFARVDFQASVLSAAPRCSQYLFLFLLWKSLSAVSPTLRVISSTKINTPHLPLGQKGDKWPILTASLLPAFLQIPRGLAPALWFQR